MILEMMTIRAKAGLIGSLVLGGEFFPFDLYHLRFFISPSYSPPHPLTHQHRRLH